MKYYLINLSIEYASAAISKKLIQVVPNPSYFMYIGGILNKCIQP